jgi:hypothetical protein
MFFTECAHLAEQHPDLAGVLERLDSKLEAMGTAEVIRPDDMASFLNIDPNQMRSAIEMFARVGVLERVEMIECTSCQMTALRSEYEEALDEGNEYRCTSCDRPLKDKTIQIITTYRRGKKWHGDAGLREASSSSTSDVAESTSQKSERPTDVLRDQEAQAPKENREIKKSVRRNGKSSEKGGRPVTLVDGDRIKELRGESTQAAFARFCKISPDALQRAERHGRSSERTILKIANKLRKQGHNIKAKDLIKNTPQ